MPFVERCSHIGLLDYLTSFPIPIATKFHGIAVWRYCQQLPSPATRR
jgi:hypothetical protein